MSMKIKVTKDYDAKVGRGLVALKAGWSGAVKDEVAKAAIEAGAATEIESSKQNKPDPKKTDSKTLEAPKGADGKKPLG